MSALAKYLAKMGAGAKSLGKAGMGLGAVGLAKGVEAAEEHPMLAKMLGSGAAGAGGALAINKLLGDDEDPMREDMERMMEKYPEEAGEIRRAYRRNNGV